MPTPRGNLRQITEMAWVISQNEHHELSEVLEAWVARQFPYRLTIDDHVGLSSDLISQWIETNCAGGAFAGILEGDGGPMTVGFQKREDAVRFKLTCL